jgi:anti-sigma factor RsiW
MNCGHPRELLDAYVDAELDAAGNLDVERHLAECPACAGVVASRRSLRTALRDPGLRAVAPKGLVDRVRPPAPAPNRRRTWPGLVSAFAAGVILTLGLGLGIEHAIVADAGPTAGEIVAAHVRSLQADHLVDVASSDRHTVKPWFAGKLDFAPIVADFADQGFPLVGGRLDYLGGRPAAALVFKRREHTINVFLQPRRESSAADKVLPKVPQGYHLRHDVVDGLDCWMISDASMADLDELHRLLAEVK